MIIANSVLWITANFVLFYVFAVMFLFTGTYFIGLKWEEEPAGRRIMQFMASLLGVMFLVVLSFIVEPQKIFQAPDHGFIGLVRGSLRILIYGWVAKSTTSLFADIIRRLREGRQVRIMGTEIDPRTQPRFPRRKD